MNSLIVILSILAIFQLGQAAPVTPTDCSGYTVLFPPSDLNRPNYWPTRWTEDLEAPPLTIDHTCNITLSIPKGLYVRLVMKGKMDGDATFVLNKGAAFEEMVNMTNLEPRFFANDRMSLFLMSGMKSNTGTLGLKVNWYKFPTATPTRDFLEIGLAKFVSASKTSNGVIYSTSQDSQVSLVPAPMNSMNLNSLRNTVIFDGPSYFANFSGSLYDLYKTRKQFISTSYKFTLITFEPMNTLDMFAVQDHGDTMGISEYTAVVCDDMMNCPMILNATAGKSASISYYKQGETLTSAYMAPDATLSVYAGTISTQNLLNSYTSSTVKSSLPHTYYQYIKNYVLDKGVAVVNINRK